MSEIAGSAKHGFRRQGRPRAPTIKIFGNCRDGHGVRRSASRRCGCARGEGGRPSRARPWAAISRLMCRGSCSRPLCSPLAIRVHSGIQVLSRHKPRQSRDCKGAGGTLRSKVDGRDSLPALPSGLVAGRLEKRLRRLDGPLAGAASGCNFEEPATDAYALARNPRIRHHRRPFANCGSAGPFPSAFPTRIRRLGTDRATFRPLASDNLAL